MEAIPAEMRTIVCWYMPDFSFMFTVKQASTDCQVTLHPTKPKPAMVHDARVSARWQHKQGINPEQWDLFSEGSDPREGRYHRHIWNSYLIKKKIAVQ
jgi:hypothetical protein